MAMSVPATVSIRPSQTIRTVRSTMAEGSWSTAPGWLRGHQGARLPGRHGRRCRQWPRRGRGTCRRWASSPVLGHHDEFGVDAARRRRPRPRRSRHGWLRDFPAGRAAPGGPPGFRGRQRSRSGRPAGRGHPCGLRRQSGPWPGGRSHAGPGSSGGRRCPTPRRTHSATVASMMSGIAGVEAAGDVGAGHDLQKGRSSPIV